MRGLQGLASNVQVGRAVLCTPPRCNHKERRALATASKLHDAPYQRRTNASGFGRAGSPLHAVLFAIQTSARTGVTRPTKRALPCGAHDAAHDFCKSFKILLTRFGACCKSRGTNSRRRFLWKGFWGFRE